MWLKLSIYGSDQRELINMNKIIQIRQRYTNGSYLLTIDGYSIEVRETLEQIEQMLSVGKNRS